MVDEPIEMVGTVFILTSEMDPDSFAWLDGLRREHFPPERNLLPAHITFFHRLASSQVARLQHFESPAAPLTIRFDAPVLLGAGVAVRIASPELEQLRHAIKVAVGGDFSRQDEQHWKPHVTIQNKTSSETARVLHRSLEAEYTARTGAATGLLIWEYLGGPWTLVKRIGFGAPRDPWSRTTADR